MKNSSAFAQRLVQLLAGLHALPAAADPATKVMELMEEVAVVYFAIRAEAALGKTREFKQFIADSTPFVARALPWIDRYFTPRIEQLLRTNWYGDEWQVVCRMRSSLAALFELYPPAAISTEVQMETDDTDELLRDRGSREGSGASMPAPPGTPRSHWWWWLPE